MITGGIRITGLLFWLYLTGAAVCMTIKYGPGVGIVAFIALAIAAMLVGVSAERS